MSFPSCPLETCSHVTKLQPTECKPQCCVAVPRWLPKMTGVLCCLACPLVLGYPAVWKAEVVAEGSLWTCDIVAKQKVKAAWGQQPWSPLLNPELLMSVRQDKQWGERESILLKYNIMNKRATQTLDRWSKNWKARATSSPLISFYMLSYKNRET
jgi:hypothetical protein